MKSLLWLALVVMMVTPVGFARTFDIPSHLKVDTSGGKHDPRTRSRARTAEMDKFGVDRQDFQTRTGLNLNDILKIEDPAKRADAFRNANLEIAKRQGELPARTVEIWQGLYAREIMETDGANLGNSSKASVAFAKLQAEEPSKTLEGQLNPFEALPLEVAGPVKTLLTTFSSQSKKNAQAALFFTQSVLPRVSAAMAATDEASAKRRGLAQALSGADRAELAKMVADVAKAQAGNKNGVDKQALVGILDFINQRASSGEIGDGTVVKRPTETAPKDITAEVATLVKDLIDDKSSAALRDGVDVFAGRVLAGQAADGVPKASADDVRAAVRRAQGIVASEALAGVENKVLRENAVADLLKTSRSLEEFNKGVEILGQKPKKKRGMKPDQITKAAVDLAAAKEGFLTLKRVGAHHFDAAKNDLKLTDSEAAAYATEKMAQFFALRMKSAEALREGKTDPVSPKILGLLDGSQHLSKAERTALDEATRAEITRLMTPDEFAAYKRKLCECAKQCAV